VTSPRAQAEGLTPVDKCFTVCFDQRYLEPALLTAWELVAHQCVPLYLVYVEGGSEDAEALRVLQAFKACVGREDVNVIRIENTVFEKFERYHFSNAILYKLALPSFIGHDVIVNVDAGFLLGPQYAMLAEQMDVALAQAPESSVVWAFCGDSAVELPQALQPLPHHALYPIGWMLVFDRRRYVAADLYARLVRTYLAVKDALVWAEQDLLCLVLEGEQLQPLPAKHTVLIEQLEPESLLNPQESAGFTEDFSLYKITGTCKPWQYWVLDAKKRFYLHRRAALQAVLDIHSMRLIHEARHWVTHPPLQRAFLEMAERANR
jgi:lipopolysaccharide biosynthesis glycosyltransferase